MRLVVLGGGPAGLYSALLLKKANPAWDVLVLERNPRDVTYGWGVVFSDRTLSSFQRADYKSYTGITEQFVIWDAIDVRYRGEVVRCGGHVIAAIERRRLLNILQARCVELGVEIRFEVDITELSQLPPYDLLLASDGVNSLVRRTYEDEFNPSVQMGRARYIWLGAHKPLDAFNFIFHETEHGLFQVHAYPFSGTTSTVIVECAEDVWLRAGLDKAGESESIAFCQRLLDADLGGLPLLSNNSKWISFPTLKVERWHIREHGSGAAVVLMGDAAHTAHFSIGSGTKLAMEDAIALAEAVEKHGDLEAALNEYELERKPVVETFQRAAQESRVYFETLKRYLALPPPQFAFQLLTRSGRISYEDLHFRDSRFGDWVDREFHALARDGTQSEVAPVPVLAPPPVFAPLRLREVTLSNRLVAQEEADVWKDDPRPTPDDPGSERPIESGVGLVVAGPVAVTEEGRRTPDDPVLGVASEDLLARISRAARQRGAAAGLLLGHAGRRGATEPPSRGLDRPLLGEAAWPLLAASAIAYTPRSQTPREMDRTEMERVREAFVRGACLADQAGFDLLVLHMAHGYLLAGFLSPLSNRREDEYGGDLAGRTRYPLELLDSVRAAWPASKPLAVALNVEDNVKGGVIIAEAVEVARMLKERGCDLVWVLAGYGVAHADLPYGRGFLTPLSDRIRNEAGIPTLVGGYLPTSNDINTVLAAGRADLCIMAGVTTGGDRTAGRLSHAGLSR